VFVKFRRKSADVPDPEETSDGADVELESAEGTEGTEDAGGPDGPFDVDELPEDDDTERIDLGSLLVPPAPDMELRLQVDEQTDTVQALMLATREGAVELRAFAAPRGGDLWGEVRPSIAADFAQRGGTATERPGRFGTELVCRLTVRGADGRTGAQDSRIIGINGPRWMLRATLLGRPAVDPDAAGEWEDLVARVAVRRGAQAMPAGAELPLVLPPRTSLAEHADPEA
jgi:hypothetical protein